MYFSGTVYYWWNPGQKFKAGTWRQEWKQKPLRSSAYCLASYDLFSWLSHTSQDHCPKSCTTQKAWTFPHKPLIWDQLNWEYKQKHQKSKIWWLQLTHIHFNNNFKYKWSPSPHQKTQVIYYRTIVKNNMLLVQQQTHKPMEWNWKPKLEYRQPQQLNIWQRTWKRKMKERKHLQQTVLGKLDADM